MTVLCGGGASGPKAGTDAAIGLSGTVIDAVVSALGFPELSPVIAVATAGTVLATDVYCTADPPDDPMLTSDDFAAAQDPSNPTAYFTALGRIKDWFLRQYWWAVCTCTGAATPSAPAPNLPSGYGSNTGLPSGTSTAPCWDTTGIFALEGEPSGGAGASGTWWADAHDPMLPSGDTFTYVDGGGNGTQNILMYRIPSPVSGLTVIATTDSPVPTGNDVRCSVTTLNQAGTSLEGNTVADVTPGNTTATATTTTLNTSAYWWGAVVSNSGPAPITVTMEVKYNCSTAPGTVTPCCPPDPLVDQYLSQILAVVTNLYSSQPTPINSFAEGTVTSGLTGNGTLSISGASISIKVDLTSLPPGIGQDVGSPTFYFDVGYITFTTVEGNYSSQRITFATQVFSVPLLANTVSYTFLSGVVATITELTRGP